MWRSNSSASGKSFGTEHGLKVHRGRYCALVCEEVEEEGAEQFVCACGQTFETEHGYKVHRGRYCTVVACKCGQKFETEHGPKVHKGRYCTMVEGEEEEEEEKEKEEEEAPNGGGLPSIYAVRAGLGWSAARAVRQQHGLQRCHVPQRRHDVPRAILDARGCRRNEVVWFYARDGAGCGDRTCAWYSGDERSRLIEMRDRVGVGWKGRFGCRCASECVCDEAVL